MGLFKPAWQSKNKNRVLKSLESIQDQKLLFEIAHGNELSYELSYGDKLEIKKRAACKISDIISLLTLYTLDSDCHHVMWHINKVFMNCTDKELLDVIRFEKKAYDLCNLSWDDVKNNKIKQFKKEAVKRLVDQNMINTLAVELDPLTDDYDVLLDLLCRVDDTAVKQQIYRQMLSSRNLDAREAAAQLLGPDSIDAAYKAETERMHFQKLCRFMNSEEAKRDRHLGSYRLFCVLPDDIMHSINAIKNKELIRALYNELLKARRVCNYGYLWRYDKEMQSEIEKRL